MFSLPPKPPSASSSAAALPNNTAPCCGTPKGKAIPLEAAATQSKYPMSGDLGVYCHRLERDGWSLASGQFKNHFVFEKLLGRDWLLRSLVNQGSSGKAGKPSTWNEYSLVHLPTQTVQHFPDWEWAEMDRSRLVWATGGQLWAGQLNNSGLNNEKMLYGFNDMHFEVIKAHKGRSHKWRMNAPKNSADAGSPSYGTAPTSRRRCAPG